MPIGALKLVSTNNVFVVYNLAGLLFSKEF